MQKNKLVKNGKKHMTSSQPYHKKEKKLLMSEKEKQQHQTLKYFL